MEARGGVAFASAYIDEPSCPDRNTPGDPRDVSPMKSPALRFRVLYVAFASGYLLSYLYRTVNAVISPELTRELALSPGALGLLTSAYFVAFAAMQIPAGMLLDRYGPRRVEPVLLLIAGTGALAFGFAGGEAELLAARALIGAGVAVCLMAPMKAIATWYPVEQQASLGGWMMVAGGIGALVATAPLEFALRFASWRAIFIVLAATTYAVAIWIWFRVPDIAKPVQAVGFKRQWAGVTSIFANRRFWWIAPLGCLGFGSFMAVQGLWSVPWLMDVNGYDRAAAARHLLVMSVVMLGGYVLVGLFATRLARRGLRPQHIFGFGFALNAAALSAVFAELPGTQAWWALYGLGATANILAFTVLNEGFARELAARANTALNLLMFIGSFATQWGIGLVIDAARTGLGFDTANGLRLAFAIVLAADTLACLWFAWGWRRHAMSMRIVATA
jgi:nitrate/nitrite transporter NarK